MRERVREAVGGPQAASWGPARPSRRLSFSPGAQGGNGRGAWPALRPSPKLWPPVAGCLPGLHGPGRARLPRRGGLARLSEPRGPDPSPLAQRLSQVSCGAQTCHVALAQALPPIAHLASSQPWDTTSRKASRTPCSGASSHRLVPCSRPGVEPVWPGACGSGRGGLAQSPEPWPGWETGRRPCASLSHASPQATRHTLAADSRAGLTRSPLWACSPPREGLHSPTHLARKSCCSEPSCLTGRSRRAGRGGRQSAER